MFIRASYRVGDSEFGEGSMMLQDPKLPTDPED